jgi:hypothetical protein
MKIPMRIGPLILILILSGTLLFMWCLPRRCEIVVLNSTNAQVSLEILIEWMGLKDSVESRRFDLSPQGQAVLPMKSCDAQVKLSYEQDGQLHTREAHLPLSRGEQYAFEILTHGGVRQGFYSQGRWITSALETDRE